MLHTVIKRSPLAFLIIWYFAGIIANSYAAVNVKYWLMACFLILTAGFIWQRKDYGVIFLIALMVSLGGLNHGMRVRRESGHISHFIDETEKRIVAVVESSESYPDGRRKIIAKDIVINDANRIRCDGKVLLRIKNSVHRYYYGDSLYFRTILREPPPKRNPGEFDYRKYLAGHHIYAVAYLDEDQVRVVAPHHSRALRRIANRIRYGIQDLVRDSMQGETAAILQALACGLCQPCNLGDNRISQNSPEAQSGYRDSCFGNVCPGSGYQALGIAGGYHGVAGAHCQRLGKTG